MGKEPSKRVIEARALLAELVGTFALMFTAVGVPAFCEGDSTVSALAPIFPGLMVLALIYALADISGAHFNPAVTLAFAVRRDFPWRMVPGYLVAQLAGAFLAALAVLALVGQTQLQAGATIPPSGAQITAFVMEIILTALLVTVILSTATGAKIVGHNAALAVGATIAVCGILGAPFSAGSMNPARSLAPNILCGSFSSLWVFIAGPLIGALIAVLIMRVMKGHPGEHEKEAAEGKVADAFLE